ncbi:hypothetical protein PN290_14405 [Romboutsia sp. 1001216sp1]|uniref:hypothetical protein n=1 Tax=unclassified Romboutsia TaxID=2626894 RepID=UPI0018A9A48D|nr:MULTISPECIES: hypothetical protein [unclassified Romboutsia]MDB8794899.1 hypothetical protein [Romboutsia sp. 1001216sp1]MDB8797726.1 hypothetical protein [Romboutsia sp. 1001216sp1]MDB8800547.1 hypothetical protein [Romboutsia sp. 1001216sp1]
MDIKSKDILLEYLVLASESGVSAGVTLLVNGDYISGNIISDKEYYEFISNIDENFNSLFSSIANEVSARYDKEKEDESVNIDRNFIHLKNVYCVNKNINSISVPLRIKISDISGFTFGTMSQN